MFIEVLEGQKCFVVRNLLEKLRVSGVPGDPSLYKQLLKWCGPGHEMVADVLLKVLTNAPQRGAYFLMQICTQLAASLDTKTWMQTYNPTRSYALGIPMQAASTVEERVTHNRSYQILQYMKCMQAKFGDPEQFTHICASSWWQCSCKEVPADPVGHF